MDTIITTSTTTSTTIERRTLPPQEFLEWEQEELLKRLEKLYQEHESSKKYHQELSASIKKNEDEFQQRQKHRDERMRQLERQEKKLLLTQRFNETRSKLNCENFLIETRLLNTMIWIPAIIVNGGLLYLVNYYYLWA